MDKEIKTIADLKEAAADSFHVVKRSEHIKGKAGVSIPVNSYAELSYFLIDVLKVSVAALEAESEGVGNVRNVASAVSGVLEKVIEIIPLEEMDLLDRIREVVDGDSV